jgi:multiple antibiotic resistance protein
MQIDIDILNIIGVALAVIVPIFVATDPLGAVPLVVGWTAELSEKDRNRQLRDALVTALGIGIAFLIAGKWILSILGVSVPDFQIAGGLILLILAISDLVLGGGHEARGSVRYPDFGVVPIGTPLLAGPATLSTLIVLVDSYGPILTTISLIVNLLLAWWLFRRANALSSLLGTNGLRAASKVVSLLLAAIAVRFISGGIFAIISMH